jgi:hypothetical protein
MVTSQDEVVDTSTSFFKSVSSSANYCPGFLQYKACKESHYISFASEATELYNSPFLLPNSEVL